MYEHPLYHWPPKSRWLEQVPSAKDWGNFSCYIHFPFCRHICSFCNYETRLISGSQVRAFADSALGELALYRSSDNFEGSSVRSLFFGGGTASLMPPELLESLVAGVKALNASSAIPEVTLECEPGTVRVDTLRRAHAAGVNRVSVCAQSFNADELRRITRQHSVLDIFNLVDFAQQSGISNIHVDLMYGLPRQSLADWEQNLRQAIALPFTHVSAYKLYVFKYGAIDRAGQAPRAELETEEQTDFLRDMYRLAQVVLEDAGFEQYTLTEWARPGFRSTFLADTFGGRDLLPIGPSAFGRCGDRIWHNSSYVNKYSDLKVWSDMREGRRLSKAEAFKRDVILGLWLLNVDVYRVAASHGVLPSAILHETFQDLDRKQTLCFDGEVVSLTQMQRFDGGRAMAELAALDAADWIDDRARSSSFSGEQPDVVLSSHLLSLLRTLRNDPVLLFQFAESPAETLKTIDVEIDLREVDALIAAVAGNRNPGLDLSSTWNDIVGEHRIGRNGTAPQAGRIQIRKPGHE